MKKKYEIAFFLCFVFVGGVMMMLGEMAMEDGHYKVWVGDWLFGHYENRYTSGFYTGQWLFILGIPVLGSGLIGALAVGASRLIDKLKGEI